jgi:hypothetical protein
MVSKTIVKNWQAEFEERIGIVPSPWKPRFLTTHEIARYFQTDPGRLQRWAVERWGAEPHANWRTPRRSAWTRRQFESVRRAIAKNRKTAISTSMIAKELGINHATIERNWRRAGLRLPRVQKPIGVPWRGRVWDREDIRRLIRFARSYYRVVGDSLGVPVKPSGVHPTAEFFRNLNRFAKKYGED